MKKLFLLCLILILANTAALAEINALVGQTMPDFSVATTDGTPLALSEILEEKDVVVLNIFASWCPPCRMEFPEMESVYRDLSDRMEIVAISDELSDTLEVITQYKAEMGLSFPMGLAADTAIADFVEIKAYPTTLVIDKSGTVGYFQQGSFASDSQFRGIVEYFLNEHYDGTPVGAFNVGVCDQYGEAVPGVVVQFCDTACQLYTTDPDGLIYFTGKPARYNVRVMRIPEGYSYDSTYEAVCDGSGEWVVIEIKKD